MAMRGRKGFSLLIVLIIAMVGLAIAGATLQITVGGSGNSRVSSAKDAKYNLLQDGIERGKAAINKIMDNDDDPPRYFTGESEPNVAITRVDQLLIKVDNPSIPIKGGVVVDETLNRQRLGRLGIMGDSARLKVKIYDMQYSAKNVAGMSKEELKLIPPSMTVDASLGETVADGTASDLEDIPIPVAAPAKNVGTYLIRASLEIGGTETVMDSVVIQANKK
jgi:hypothetical protein